MPWLLLLLPMATRLQAQGAATVPASSAVYDRIESLSALVPGVPVSLALRPISRRDLDRIVAALTARTHLLADTSARGTWALLELAAIRSALDPNTALTGGLQTRAAWQAEGVASDAPATPFVGNGLGSLDAARHPLTAGRDGRPALRGGAATIAPTIAFAGGDWIALAIQPSASLVASHGEDVAQNATLHRAYVRAVFRNIAIQLGADERRWGQSPFGALFISGNAAPLPSVQVGADTPVTLPWLFRRAGPFRWNAFIADLGRDQNPPNAKLAGWHFSVQPFSRFELAMSVLVQEGGSGGPTATLFDRLADFLAIVDVIALPHSDYTFSNKLAGGSLRLRVPELSGLDLYYELQMDDFDARRFRSSLVDDAAHLFGARLPLLVAGGQLAWRAEWHFTAIRLYEHTQFASGVTYRDRIIGNPLGPNARGGYVVATWQRSPFNSVELSIADERHDPSKFATTSNNPNEAGFRFVRLTADPHERRYAGGAKLRRTLPGGLTAHVSVRYDRTWLTGQPSHAYWTSAVLLGSRRLAVF